ncbi:TVP38/TMEM64 family protein [Nesterenkonia sp. MY13]|uniref:TVP38/TMEM64 family membrane protein n=1 Tax=Nesterenkonia sedimenti TaxID=1463632 RepID=A0A7X8TI16_9MICC|nr:VTT domain-containing protein [Nesterenkonia sedimenti]NLS09123.1 TVP38/TMEM64 family protein [Nesterenkonia sedimenti]
MNDDAENPPASGESPWQTGLRNAALIAAILGMAWVVFNVDLPPVRELQAMIADLGWAGWIVFVILCAIVAITPIPVTIVAVAGGFLFGVVIGSVLAVAGVFLGAWGAYWLARGLGKKTVLRLLGRHRERVEEHLTRAGFEAVCILRLMPGVPYWPVNYGSGVLGVRSSVYVPASLMSIIPGQVSLVAVGNFIAEPGIIAGAQVLIAWAVVICLMIIAYRRWRTARRR